MGTRAALLQALFCGPADAEALGKRVARRGRGRVPSTPREISRSLSDLLARGLLRRWQGSGPVAAGRRRRTFYELTAEGVAEAEAVRDALAGFVADAPLRSRREDPRKIDARLRRSLDISAVAGALRRTRKDASTRK
jgi:DNA-binding PadR family transcriptional regulator